MSSLLRLIEQEDLGRTEGRKGVENLCRIARLLGYKDPMYFGQLAHNASVGDLIEMLSDNSGLIDAMVDWLVEHEHCWSEQIDLETYEEEEDEDDEE